MKTHGESGYLDRPCTPEYRAWGDMLNRCYNPNNKGYLTYGFRGIKVCEKWNKFENFLEDIGRRPSPKYSLDRIDNNDDYTPLNCKWSTDKEQAENRNNSILIEYEGQTKCVKEWARVLDINYGTLRNRLKAGLTIERAFTKNLFERL